MGLFDRFIENLRNAASVYEKEQAEIKKNTDKPYFNEKEWNAAHERAYGGDSRMLILPDDAPYESDFSASDVPLSMRDLKAIAPWRDIFNKGMELYSKEPNQETRIALLDFMGNKTPLGKLPTAEYLRILRNTEDAVKREGITNYQYSPAGQHFKTLLDSEYNKFNPRA